MSDPTPRSALPPHQWWMIAGLAAFLGLAQIDQPYPRVAALQHIPTALILLASPWLLRRWPLSDAAVGSVLAFFLLHTLGGRYAYSNVPYDAWSHAVFGASISEAFGLARNGYDRLVHLSFGLLTVPVARQILVRHAGLSPRIALYMAVEFVLAFSCLYEIFEWLLTIVAAGPAAEAYNGQQGDFWDSQKDMAMAAAGAFGSAAWQRWRRGGR